MAKNAKTTEAVEKKEEKKEETKALVFVDPSKITKERLSLVPYNEKNIAEFGNGFLNSLIKHARLEEEAQEILNQAGEAKQYLTFELLRAAVDLYHKHKDDTKDAIDIYAIFGEPADVQRLNNRFLLRMGVLKKEITEDDTVKWSWTDKENEKLYSYTKDLKEENEAEYTIRFNNRKKLNARLSDAFKSACYLVDNKLTVDDLTYTEDETGRFVPTIKNAPKSVGGDAGTVQMNTRKVVKGAALSPTMASLTKLATEKHVGTKSDRMG